MFISGFHSNVQTNNSFDRFPAFNIEANKSNASNETGNFQETQTLKPKTEETPEEKRRREILEIKKQLDEINKKMELSNKGSAEQGERLNPNANRPKNSGVAQSMIFTSNNEPETHQFKVNKLTGNEPSFSPLDKLYEQKKSQQKHQYIQSKPNIEEPANKSPAFLQPKAESFQITKKEPIASLKQEPSSLKQGYLPFKEQPQSAKKEVESNILDFNPQKEDSKLEFTQPTTPEKIEFGEKNPQQISFKKKKEVLVEEALSPKHDTGKKSMLKKVLSLDVEEKMVTEEKNFKKEDFEIGKKMGKGQFGEVLLVRHKKTGFICGMKVMEKKQIREENYVGQIARELSIQFYLSHRNIAPLYGYFADEKYVYLLVEFCEGGQLLEKLRGERRMQEKDVSQIMKQVCEGVDYIHKELIIHRDIKPENILFNHGVVKISDFGWAVYRGHGLRKTASGSPLYYPPEIVKGEEYDDKIDVWNIGMMTYECLLGKIPFRIYTEMDLDRIVSMLLLRCQTKSPSPSMWTWATLRKTSS